MRVINVEKANYHFKALEALLIKYNINLSVQEVYSQLDLLERRATKIVEKFSNGKMTLDELEIMLEKIRKKVNKIFNGKLQGLIIDRDPRGYILKLSIEITNNLENEGISLIKDWGGYGILAPVLYG